MTTIGWIGVGRMGFPMADRLLAAGNELRIWNRTKSKAEPLADRGATLVNEIGELADVDVLFTMVSTGNDLREVCFGPNGLFSKVQGKGPEILVDCSSIGVDESKAIRAELGRRGTQYVVASVSGNGACVRAGKLSSVASGPKVAYDRVKDLIRAFAPRGVFYVGDGELARVCKIAHNVMLGVVIENLIEITLLAQKAGVPRHAFLEFMNNSVMGSIFTQYKTPALVNLDWSTTFTPTLLLKDLDLGLDASHEYGVPMPVTAAAREVIQMHIGLAKLREEPEKYLALDFAALLETMGLTAGMTMQSEDVAVPSGLEI
ncbi:MAG TPA: NAD(P)-dependent oxidoreductase [Stellaceae bacterium]|nr:NAD(P)-dependent oxidoreductase [Stellaceae bacterium]